MKLLSIFIILTLSLLGSKISFAQEISDNATNALNLIKNQKSPILIDSLSLPHYEAAFIPELSNQIAEHDLVVSAHALAPETFKLDNSWINAALKGGTRSLEKLTALPNQDNPKGPAFGSYEEIIKGTDSVIVARKLLWNVVSLLESNRFIALDLNISWSNQGASQADKLAAQLVVTYPGAMKLGQSVAMREKFSVTEPAWLSSFTLLTLRQYGANEDLVWYFSPTLNTTRELAGSLRGDPLFQSLFSLDDFLAFSAKPELLEPAASTAFETLVPFVSAKSSLTAAPSNPADCQNYTNPQLDSSNPINAFYFAARKVFALELKQLDPFSVVGRQKLYVDAATMLPFFREEYAQNGELKKSALAGFSLLNFAKSESKSQQETHVIPNTVVAFGKSGNISISKTVGAKVC